MDVDFIWIDYVAPLCVLGKSSDNAEDVGKSFFQLAPFGPEKFSDGGIIIY